MASLEFISLLVLLSFLSVYASRSCFEDQGINVPYPQEPQTLKGPPTKVEKVELVLYYETLCPYCAKFIVKELIKVFDRDLMNIVNLRLVPYGNAHIQEPDNTIVCQHGPDECYLNSIHACAINSWPDVLILQYANETNHLVPPHTYVTWVVVNNQPLYHDYQNFVSYVCKAYKGSPKQRFADHFCPRSTQLEMQTQTDKGEEIQELLKLSK